MTRKSRGSAERLAVLEYLTERGATSEQMVEAHRFGTLPGVAADLVTQGLSEDTNVADVAVRAGADRPQDAHLAGRRHPGPG
jgi:hypothetical protein